MNDIRHITMSTYYPEEAMTKLQIGDNPEAARIFYQSDDMENLCIHGTLLNRLSWAKSVCDRYYPETVWDYKLTICINECLPRYESKDGIRQ